VRSLLLLSGGRGGGLSDVCSGKRRRGVYIVVASGRQNIALRFDLPVHLEHK
jgi:predicted ATPase